MVLIKSIKSTKAFSRKYIGLAKNWSCRHLLEVSVFTGLKTLGMHVWIWEHVCLGFRGLINSTPYLLGSRVPAGNRTYPDGSNEETLMRKLLQRDGQG